MILIPKGSALVSSKLIVWGRVFDETKKSLILFFFWSLDLRLNNIVIASAAAVLSSSNDALAKSIPVKSEIIVW